MWLPAKAALSKYSAVTIPRRTGPASGTHVLALERLLDGAASDFYNLGQGQGFSVKEVVDHVARVTGRDIATVDVDRRPGDPPVLVASNAKALKYLNWQPEFTNLDDIIHTAWNWHRRL